jgi:hypothetical protein
MKIIINLGREILLLGSVRESIMKPSETSSGKKLLSLRVNFIVTGSEEPRNSNRISILFLPVTI